METKRAGPDNIPMTDSPTGTGGSTVRAKAKATPESGVAFLITSGGRPQKRKRPPARIGSGTLAPEPSRRDAPPGGLRVTLSVVVVNRLDEGFDQTLRG